MAHLLEGRGNREIGGAELRPGEKFGDLVGVGIGGVVLFAQIRCAAGLSRRQFHEFRAVGFDRSFHDPASIAEIVPNSKSAK